MDRPWRTSPPLSGFWPQTENLSWEDTTTLRNTLIVSDVRIPILASMGKMRPNVEKKIMMKLDNGDTA